MPLPDPPERYSQQWARSMQQTVDQRHEDLLGRGLFFSRHFSRRYCQVSVSAAGTAQAGATALVADIVHIGTVGAGTAEGVRLPTARAGMQLFLANRGTGTAKVYPATGERIDALGTNAAFNLVGTKAVIMTAPVDQQWYSLLGA